MSDATPTLHALATPDPQRGGLCAGELLGPLLAHEAGHRDRVLIFGTSADRAAARALGVRAPLLTARRWAGRGFDASRRITRAARSLGLTRVVLWSPELVRAAARVAAAGLAVEGCFVEPPDDGHGWSVGPRAGRGLTRTRVADQPLAEAWGGLGAGAIEVRGFESPGPALDRATARARLGVGNETVIVPLVGDPRRVDARALAFISGVVELMGTRHVLVAPEGASRWASSLRFRRRTTLASPMLVAAPPFLPMIAAADLLIAPAEFTAGGAVAGLLGGLAARARVEIASTVGWSLEPGVGNAPSALDLRACVGPVLAGLRAGGGAAR